MTVTIWYDVGEYDNDNNNDDDGDFHYDNEDDDALYFTICMWYMTYGLGNGMSRQSSGGVLINDVYKVYLNPLLDRLREASMGSTIGDVKCEASACADDICLCAETVNEAQEHFITAPQYGALPVTTYQERAYPC
ncbi:hypothetical protein DPMN_082342 [Dreissena polymorpha]|uniref:Uncharacterized protein n=1 Tax=Dreissena polymorpha TaxID=45954 RepID=A0A9D4BGR9_DREPO|nr:hypothetical protein DPMN_082342 [Dreissena polymorpha]